MKPHYLVILGKIRKLSEDWRRGICCAAHEQDAFLQKTDGGALHKLGKVVCWRGRTGEHYIAFDNENIMCNEEHRSANAAAAGLVRLRAQARAKIEHG